MVLARLGSADAARESFTDGLCHAQALPNPYTEARILVQLGLLQLREGETEEAHAYLQRGLAIFQRLSNVAEVLGTFQAASRRASSRVKDPKNSWTPSIKASMDPWSRSAAIRSFSRHQTFSTGLCLWPL